MPFARFRIEYREIGHSEPVLRAGIGFQHVIDASGPQRAEQSRLLRSLEKGVNLGHTNIYPRLHAICQQVWRMFTFNG